MHDSRIRAQPELDYRHRVYTGSSRERTHAVGAPWGSYDVPEELQEPFFAQHHFGKLPALESAHAISVIDPAFPAVLRAVFETTLPRLL